MVKQKKSACPGALIRHWLGLVFGALIVSALGTAVNIASSTDAHAAQVEAAAEYELKAAFLLNFIKFTEWPADESNKTSEPFVIGVLGKDPFGTALDRATEGETTHNRKIVVRRFTRMDDVAASSQILFISASEERNLAGILKLLEGQAVLTVSEIANFAERGGIIDLKKENNKIVFEINLLTAKRAGLSINAQLLRVAKAVRGKT